MTTPQTKTLILACGNSLRSDDGVALVLAEFAQHHIDETNANARVIARQQWAPELAADIAAADSVLFLDCALNIPPGEVLLQAVAPAANFEPSTHHLHAAELLVLAQLLYGATPARAQLLTIGAANLALGETLSAPVLAALPIAKEKIKKALEA